MLMRRNTWKVKVDNIAATVKVSSIVNTIPSSAYKQANKKKPKRNNGEMELAQIPLERGKKFKKNQKISYLSNLGVIILH